MARAKRCPICLSDADTLARANALLESGARLATIVAELGKFTTFQLSRHKNLHLLKATNGDTADGSEADIWIKRAHETYAQAVIDGNVAARISAITAAGRALERIRKSEAEKKEDALPADCNAWTDGQAAQFQQYIDSVMQKAQTAAGWDSAIARMNWLYSLDPKTLAMFRRVTSDPALLTAVEQLEANQLPQRPTTP
jgi:hypothetical protein